MPDTIDVSGLNEQDIKLVVALVKRLQKRPRRKKGGEAKEEITFSSWPLGVKGRLTRREIYDYL